jgi:hypothetical protein
VGPAECQTKPINRCSGALVAARARRDAGTYRDKLDAGERPAFIGFDEANDFIAEAAWLTRQFGDRRFSFRTSDQASQAAAARAGYGVALPATISGGQ